MAYDTTNDIKAPETKGFVGGNFFSDNSTAYVGFGYFPGIDCSGQSPAPGFISTNSSAPGVYLPCGSLRYDNFSAYYLQKHSDLKWIPTNLNNVLKVPGILKINDQQSFLFSRVWMNGIYYLGKLYGTATPSFWITLAAGEKKIDVGFEVLACLNTTFQNPCGKLDLSFENLF